jgi:hypothetical protein
MRMLVVLGSYQNRAVTVSNQLIFEGGRVAGGKNDRDRGVQCNLSVSQFIVYIST